MEVTEVGVVKGKIHYMSPEQYSGADVDRRSDIYSLCVIIYQLTTGRLPWVTKGGNVSMRRVHDGKIPRPLDIRPDYPPELDAIVMRGLAYEPERTLPRCGGRCGTN